MTEPFQCAECEAIANEILDAVTELRSSPRRSETSSQRNTLSEIVRTISTDFQTYSSFVQRVRAKLRRNLTPKFGMRCGMRYATHFARWRTTRRKPAIGCGPSSDPARLLPPFSQRKV